MRAGWVGNLELRKRLWCADPTAGLIAEVVKAYNFDVKDTLEEWSGADSVSGITPHKDGTVRLTGNWITPAENTNTHAAAYDITDLPNQFGSPISVGVVEWSGGDAENRSIFSFTAYLDPDYSDDGTEEVSEWIGQLFRVDRVRYNDVDESLHWELAPLTNPISATAGGSQGNVEFVCTDDDDGAAPIVGPGPVRDSEIEGSDGPRRPTTVCAIWAIKSDGTQATDVAWHCSEDMEVTSNSHSLTRYTLTTPEGPKDERGSVWSAAQAQGVPLFALKSKSFDEATLTFTVASNQLDLGAAPTGDVEFLLHALTPGGSQVTMACGKDPALWYPLPESS
jgi:hypothetical protein